MTSALAARNVQTEPARLRIAAELRWSQPGWTWQQIADEVGVSLRQMSRWRETERWEVAFRDAGNAYVEKLAPAAVHALVKAWAKGNSAGAIDVLRSFGFLRAEEVKLEVTQQQTAQVTALIQDALAAFAATHGLSLEDDERLRAFVAERLPDRIG